jgi:hypothetical protein
MNYLTELLSLSNKSKYAMLYYSIITRAVARANNKKDAVATLGIFERHHILPKSFKMGGDKDPLNYAYLTLKEHFIVHKLLMRMFSCTLLTRKMRYAFVCFAMNKSGRRILKAADYAKAKQEMIDLNKMNRPWCIGRKSPFKGKTHTPEKRKQISDSRKGQKTSRVYSPLSKESKEKISIANKGKSHAPTYGMLGKTTTEEAKAKQREYGWYNNGTVSKKIKPEQLENYPGFVAGRIAPLRKGNSDITP